MVLCSICMKGDLGNFWSDQDLPRFGHLTHNNNSKVSSRSSTVGDNVVCPTIAEKDQRLLSHVYALFHKRENVFVVESFLIHSILSPCWFWKILKLAGYQNSELGA